MIFLLSFWDQIKVNGQDISRASLQEVLQTLQSTGEQITLELHRQTSAHQTPCTSDAATQTDFRVGNEKCHKDENCSKPGLNLCLDGAFFDYLLPQDCNSDNEFHYPLPAPCATGEELNCKALALVHQDELSFSSCSSIPAALSSVSGSLAESESSKGTEEKQAFPHPAWDSGQGFTETSTRAGENSGPDAGAEPASGQEGPSADLGASASAWRGLLTDDFPTYDELSDSSFCGISAEECRRFQELLESRCSQYRPISMEHEMPQGSGGQEGGCKRYKQGQWFPKCLRVGENSTPKEKGLQHRGELCLQSALRGDRSKASKNKPSAQARDACPPPCIAASSKELTIPDHARHYSSRRFLQEKASVERPSDPARVSAKPRRCSESPEGRAGDNGNRRRLPCERSKRSLKNQHRNWLLKDRALRIAEQQSGLTTEEDAFSELKTGKYWNKAQRKQHMLLAKEQKQRKALQSQRQQLSEDKASTEHGRNFSIVELSQRKLMKNRSKKILDNWITIQELLTHGTRSPDGIRTYSPLLSVTAV